MTPKSRSLLTPTEWLVLERLARGESNVHIGRALGIGVGTVGHHAMAIYQKLRLPAGRHKRAGAADWYRREGWRRRQQEEGR